MRHTRVLGSGSWTMFIGPFKDARFGRFSNLHTCISLVEVCRLEQCLGGYFWRCQFTFPLSFRARLAVWHTLTFGVGILNYAHRAFKDASFGPLLNLHVYILLVGVFRFRHCLDETFSPMSTFFSLVPSRAIKDAPHSRFLCGDPKLCLRGSLKMLVKPSPKSS